MLGLLINIRDGVMLLLGLPTRIVLPRVGSLIVSRLQE
jgi:hypothetical protein